MFSALLALALSTPPVPAGPDLPPLTDLAWLPANDVALTARCQARRYRLMLATQAAIEPWRGAWFAAADQDAADCFRAWDLLEDASGQLSDEYRRRCLEALRDLIGPKAYYAGRLPPAVPLWRFSRIE